MVWTAIGRQADAVGIVEEEGHTSSDEHVSLYRAPNYVVASAFREWVERLTDNMPSHHCDQLTARFVTPDSWQSELLLDWILDGMATCYERADATDDRESSDPR